MIKLYPTRVESIDENDNIIFSITALDENTCTMEFKGCISKGNLDEILEAIHDAVTMLELEP